MDWVEEWKIFVKTLLRIQSWEDKWISQQVLFGTLGCCPRWASSIGRSLGIKFNFGSYSEERVVCDK